MNVIKIEDEFKKNGYKCERKSATVTVYSLIQNEKTVKLAIMVDAYAAMCNTTATAEKIRKEELAQHHFSSDVNVVPLLIVTGYKSEMNIETENLITIDGESNKILDANVDKEYKPEFGFVKAGLYREKQKLKRWHSENATFQQKTYYAFLPYVLIALNLFLFAKTTWTGTDTWSISANKVLYAGQSYRLFTYMFMHAGFGHVLTNSISLWYIGRLLGKKIGDFDLMIVYLFGGINAGLVSCYIGRLGFKDINATTVGASGAIFALLGALLAYELYHKTASAKYMLAYSAITIVMNSIGWNIDVACHIGGFFAGFTIMIVMALLDSIHADVSYVRASRKERL